MELTAEEKKTKKILDQVEETLTTGAKTIEAAVAKQLEEGASKAEDSITSALDQIEKMNNSITDVQKQIKTLGEFSIPGAEKEMKDFSVQMVCRAISQEATPGKAATAWVGAEKEKELMDCFEKSDRGKLVMAQRTANIASDGSLGGYLIPPEISKEIVGITYANIPLLNDLPVRKLTGLVGDLHIPKMTGGTTYRMCGENTKPAESNATFGEILTREKRIAVTTRQSKRLIYQSRGVSEQVIKMDMGKQLAQGIHEQFLIGAGAEYEVWGLLNQPAADFTSTTLAIGTNGGRLTVTGAEHMKMDIRVANEGNDSPNNYGFLFRPEVEFGLASERVEQFSGQGASSGQPVLAPSFAHMSSETLRSIIGKFATTTQIGRAETKGTGTTLSKVIYGNWDYFWTCFWEGMVLRASDQAYDGTNSAFHQNQIMLIVEQGINCALTRGTAFTLVSEAATSF